MGLGLGFLGLRQTRVRTRARLRVLNSKPACSSLQKRQDHFHLNVFRESRACFTLGITWVFLAIFSVPDIEALVLSFKTFS